MENRDRADLHVHTTASDGSLTPEQVVQKAARAGLGAVGIADHDTIAGIAPAIAESLKVGITVVPGVEINTDYGKDELHVLGYYMDLDHPALRAHLQHLREGRLERGQKMVQRLNELGVNITFDSVMEISGGGAVGRPHVARAIVNAGYANSMNDAFAKYLVRGAAAYIPRYKITPFEAVGIIRESSGVPVLAHPGNSQHDNLIPQLVEAGLQGLEVFHTDHTGSETNHYRKLARKYNLVATGGSDSHGPNVLRHVPIGNVTVDISVVEQLRELARQHRRE